MRRVQINPSECLIHHLWFMNSDNIFAFSSKRLIVDRSNQLNLFSKIQNPAKHLKHMDTTNFTTSFAVEQSPLEVFHAINNVRGWWSESIEGNTEKINEEFLYYYKDVHVCKIKILEYIPGKKIVWLVLDNYFNFTEDKSEWKGNKIIFEISETDSKTQIGFTQAGLTPSYECYNVCKDAWTSYIQGSLKSLITTGKGKPNTKENQLNAELIKKWNLPIK